ncbi:MAG: trimethylamine methyltransferase family protein, partial [Planctomycetes bacterium]|nr:trimethylamine methyltransferase family protein [Planctomycetota bacterium]
MGRVSGLLKMLSAEEMENLHRGALSILEETGMWIDAHDARRYLEAAGCEVDDDAKRVRFPPSVVEDAVSRMRAQYADRSQGEIWANVRYSRAYFTSKPHCLHTDFTTNAGGFPPFILDLEGRRRKATMQDVIDGIKLADALENIDMTGLPVSAQEVPYPEPRP